VPGRQYWNEPRNTPDLEGIRSLSTVESDLWVAEADTLRAARGTNCELQDTSYGGKLTEMAFNGTATMAANEPVLSAVHAGTPILQIRDLRTNLLELSALSLSAGECIAVQGPSGAGKTLLLRTGMIRRLQTRGTDVLLTLVSRG